MKVNHLFLLLAVLCTTVILAGTANAIFTNTSQINIWADFSDGSGTTVTDAAGHENGTINGSLTWNNTAGKPANLPYVLSGSFSATTLVYWLNKNYTNQASNTDNYTRSIWVKDGCSVVSLGYLGQYDGTTSTMQIGEDSAKTLYGYIITGGGSPQATATGFKCGASWTMITLVEQGSGTGSKNESIYINGTFAGSVNSSSITSPYSKGNLKAGWTDESGGTNGYQSIGQVILVNETMNAGNITCLYNSGAGRTYSQFTTNCLTNPSTYSSITANDSYTGSSLQDFNVTINGRGGYRTTNGSITLYPLYDQSGSNTTINNSGTTYNLTSQSYYFNGSNSILNIPYSQRLNFSTTGMTISVNVNTASLTFPATTKDIISQYDFSGNNRMYELTLSASGFATFSIYYDGSLGNVTKIVGSQPTVGEFTSLIVTFNSSNVSLYMNGILSASATPAFNRFFDSNTGLYIGDTQSQGSPFNGSIKDVQIWNRTLSSSEISTVVNNGSVLNNRVEWLPFDNWTSSSPSTLLNVTNATANYYATSGQIATNWNTTSNLNLSLAPLVNVTLKDYYDNTSILTFNATIDNLTSLTTTTGTIVTAISRNDTHNHDFNYSGLNYFKISYSNINVSSGWHNASAYQSVINFNANEIITGNSVSGFTVTTTNESNYSSGSPYLLLKAGNYNVTFNKTGWFNSTQQFAAGLLVNNTQTFSGVYQYVLNVSVKNASSGSSVSSYSVYIYNSTYGYYANGSTTNGSLLFPVAGGSYNVTINTTGWSVTSGFVVVSGSTPEVFNYTFYAFPTNTVQFNIRDATTGLLVNVSTNISLVGSGVTYNFSTSNGTYLTPQINSDTYFVTVSTAGYNLPTTALLTTSGGFENVTYFVDSHLIAVDFAVLDTLGNPGANITVTYVQNVNGSLVTFAQVVTDYSGLFVVNLNPTITYAMSAVDPSGVYATFTGNVKPEVIGNTYLITLQFVNGGGAYNPSGGVYSAYDAVYSNSSKTINVTWEVVSSSGSIVWFSLNTTYNGTVYSQNISGIPGGGIASVVIPGVDLSVQNGINVTFNYKVVNSSQVLQYIVPFTFFDATPRSTSLLGGVFSAPTSPSSGLGRAILGMFIVLLAVAAMYAYTGMPSVAALTGIITVGLLGTPAISLFPALFSIITVVVSTVVLVANEVNRR